MSMWLRPPSGRDVRSLALELGRALFLLLPTALLFWSSFRVESHVRIMLGLGSAFQGIVCILHLSSCGTKDQPLGPSIVALYLIALGWLRISTGDTHDWVLNLSGALLLVVPLVAFAQQILTNSGAPAVRRARVLAERLANRHDWPTDLAACRTLPEVKALREALHVDASPALMLLHHPRLEVRIAALGALEFYKSWRPGQAEMVLREAQKSTEPAFRAAAVMALANLDDRMLVEAVSEFLRDCALEVRRAAVEALLWDSENRWRWISHQIRYTLADPANKDDGPLRHDGQILTVEAVIDLSAWAAEKGILSLRAAQTLSVHYGRCLCEKPEEGLLEELSCQLSNPRTPPILRMELLRLLQSVGSLDLRQAARLMDGSHPAPLRLLAIDAVLSGGSDSAALAALREVARVPNREIALAAGEVIQRRLNVDMGVPLGQALPPVHSREAADIARRVLLWANQAERRPPTMVAEFVL